MLKTDNILETLVRRVMGEKMWMEKNLGFSVHLRHLEFSWFSHIEA